MAKTLTIIRLLNNELSYKEKKSRMNITICHNLTKSGDGGPIPLLSELSPEDRKDCEWAPLFSALMSAFHGAPSNELGRMENNPRPTLSWRAQAS